MQYKAFMSGLPDQLKGLDTVGKVANYIPALAEVSADKFGLCLQTLAGQSYNTGDCDERFSIQSISKVFTLSLAMGFVADEVWDRVGREPSGNPFNSLVQLEYENGVPRNPFINAGAIVISDILVSNLANPKQDLLKYMCDLTGVADLAFDEKVARSESDTGFINRALANFLKGHGNLENDVEEVLDLYFHQCSLAMSCRELASCTQYLAGASLPEELVNTGLNPMQVKRVNAMMLTCGLYDEVGEFAFRVGLPAKSGVGGGIIAVLPGEYSVAVWSPALGESGNSVKGSAALEYLTTATGRSVF